MDKAMRIYSPESMTAAIRHFGIIPFFKGKIPGWSIEELTDPDCWFTSSEELGPWDWKIEAVREGDIAYGKFLGGKAAFSTVEYYRHLMNWRRCIPKYRICLREKYTARTRSEQLLKFLSPAALEIIQLHQACEMSEIREALSGAVTPAVLKKMGKYYKANLSPTVKKSVADFIVQYLEMGTWCVIGDFKRVYKGPNMEYHGWQRSSHTTPDLLFGQGQSTQEDAPFWAKLIEESSSTGTTPLSVDCSPAESLDFLVKHVADMTKFSDPEEIRKLLK